LVFEAFDYSNAKRSRRNQKTPKEINSQGSPGFLFGMATIY